MELNSTPPPPNPIPLTHRVKKVSFPALSQEVKEGTRAPARVNRGACGHFTIINIPFQMPLAADTVWGGGGYWAVCSQSDTFCKHEIKCLKKAAD